MRMIIIASAFERLQAGNIMDQKGEFSPRATKLAMVEPSLEMGNVSKEFLEMLGIPHKAPSRVFN